MEAYQQLEVEWSKYLDLSTPIESMVSCSSGTAALHLALEVMRANAQPMFVGGKIIIPDYTMIACARACTLAGYEPYPVDCGKDLLMNPDIVASVIDDDVRGIMAVHIYGRRCNMDRLAATAITNHLFLIEDMAELQGVKPHPATDAACWSFYKNKVIAGEEGGAVWFYPNNDAKQPNYQLARELRCQGFTAKHNFFHTRRGHNYRLANCLAKEVLRNWDKNDSLCPAAGERMLEWGPAKRRQIEQWYNGNCPPAWRMPPRDSPWVYDLRIPNMDYSLQTEIVAQLNATGFPARQGFKRISLQDEYRRNFKRRGTEADRASSEIIYLPLAPGCIDSEPEAEGIFERISNIVQNDRAHKRAGL